ncbi:MAG: CrcB family protein [Pseudomonadota bacterium]
MGAIPLFVSSVSLSILAAGLGGAIGAALRFAFLSFGIGGALGIAILNVAGSFGLGLALVLLAGRSEVITVLITAGLFGGLTTFSTFAADIVRLGSDDLPLTVIYLFASVTIAVFAFMAGQWVGKALA